MYSNAPEYRDDRIQEKVAQVETVEPVYRLRFMPAVVIPRRGLAKVTGLSAGQIRREEVMRKWRCMSRSWSSQQINNDRSPFKLGVRLRCRVGVDGLFREM